MLIELGVLLLSLSIMHTKIECDSLCLSNSLICINVYTLAVAIALLLLDAYIDNDSGKSVHQGHSMILLLPEILLKSRLEMGLRSSCKETVWFPAVLSGSSQPPLAPVPGSLAPSFGLCRHLQ